MAVVNDIILMAIINIGFTVVKLPLGKHYKSNWRQTQEL